jgi:diketogulonate reductase-like aldo/keto reductase
MPIREICLNDGTRLPALGQGTWYMGEDRSMEKYEIAALRRGLELGMRVIDSAEMYAQGGAEKVVGKAISGRRDDVFLVSKVYPHNAGGHALQQSCEDSLRRLKTDYLDLYLLHWRGRFPFSETIAGMGKLIAEGKIRRWGVSNLDVSDMDELRACAGGDNCAVNQVLYHLGSRGIEFDLLPWQRRRKMPVMAYSPLAQAGALDRALAGCGALQGVADRHRVTIFQILLAWVMRHDHVMAIPKATAIAHVEANAQAAEIVLSAADLAELDAAFPGPVGKQPLDIV